MTHTIITFEIHDITSCEILAENLPFDDVPELVMAYQLLEPTHEIVAVCREITVTERVHHIPREQFKCEWFDLLDDIIDNLYNS